MCKALCQGQRKAQGKYDSGPKVYGSQRPRIPKLNISSAQGMVAECGN